MLECWIGVEALMIREKSFLDPLYAAIGLLMVLAGRRWLAATARRIRPRNSHR